MQQFWLFLKKSELSIYRKTIVSGCTVRTVVGLSMTNVFVFFSTQPLLLGFYMVYVPPVRWTTALPAKSWNPMILNQPSGCHTQWAIIG